MKKVVPFTKTITFKTMIAEVTDIEVTHNLSLKDNHEVSGDILVDGRYKMTDASQIEEKFHYELPFEIEIDSKYDLSDIEIIIGDFYFEIINEEDLKINVEIDLNGLEEKKIEETVKKIEVLSDNRNKIDEDVIPIPVEVTNTKEKLELNNVSEIENTNPLEKLEQEIMQDLEINNNTNNIVSNKQTNTSNSVSSIFSSITSNEETFATYYVYIVRELDTVDTILEKYNINRELLQSYNNLDDIKIGSKLIIPCINNE